MEKNIMKQIINFIDTDVDGCGTNVETMIQIEGDQALTNGAIKRIKDVIERYKKENYGEYSTDDVVEAACEQLGREGYIYECLPSDIAIEF
jgi:hypothetical protein